VRDDLADICKNNEIGRKEAKIYVSNIYKLFEKIMTVLNKIAIVWSGRWKKDFVP